MVVEHSLGRTLQRLIVRQLTSAGRWPSLWSRAVSANAHLSSFPMPLAFPSPCQCSLRPMVLSSMD